MFFTDAVINMQAGKRLIRTGWSGYYLTVLYGQSYIWSIGLSGSQPSVNASVYTPTTDDILASDWIIKTT